MVIPKTIPAVVTTPPVAGERADDAGAQAGAGLFANLHGQQQIVVGPDSTSAARATLVAPLCTRSVCSSALEVCSESHISREPGRMASHSITG